MLDAAKLRRRLVLRSWLATVYIVDGQGSATARGTRRHVGGVHIVFVGGCAHTGICAYCIYGRCAHCRRCMNQVGTYAMCCLCILHCAFCTVLFVH